ncbi:MAG TPA: ATP synthase F1 subunit delta [Thermoanaerobaculia bacterium]|nr:ATP synthase F1 subunit delta [Thermoanaerobaculia bacterium]
MTTVSERDLPIARVYAKAMLALAEEQVQTNTLLAELSELAAYVEHDRELGDFLASPLVDAAAREEVLEKTLRGRASDLLVDALEVINRKGRLGLLRAIAQVYRAEYRELRGLVDARVTTAVPLTEELRGRLLAALARFTGRSPELSERVDPSILGGMVVEVEGKKIDSSLTTSLHDLAAALAQRGLQEIYRGALAFSA